MCYIDDEILGIIGGTVARHSDAGDLVHVLIVAKVQHHININVVVLIVTSCRLAKAVKVQDQILGAGYENY